MQQLTHYIGTTLLHTHTLRSLMSVYTSRLSIQRKNVFTILSSHVDNKFLTSNIQNTKYIVVLILEYCYIELTQPEGTKY